MKIVVLKHLFIARTVLVHRMTDMGKHLCILAKKKNMAFHLLNLDAKAFVITNVQEQTGQFLVTEQL